MKRFIAMALTLAMCLTAGCFFSGNEQAAATPDATAYSDGVYYAIADEYDNGWKSVLSFVVENGAIVSANWDALPLNGSQTKAAMAAEGTYSMKVAGATLEWDAQSKLLTDALVAQQALPAAELDESGKTDAISGVTIGVSDAYTLFDKALAQGAVQPGELQDGLYYAEAQQYDNNGYKEYVALYVAGGRIIWVNWNGAKQDSTDSKKSIGDAYGMKVASSIGADWYQQADSFGDYVVENQGVTGIVVNESGKTDAVSGCTMTVSGAVALTEQAIAQAQVVVA